MLGHSHFYHQLTKKAVILFGRLFDDISIIRKNDQTGAETQRFQVPIIYAPKEKMVTRIFSDPDLTRQLQTILPRMSFEITGISYDAARKQNSLLKTNQTSTSTTASTAYVGVPYDLTFELNVYARNIDDGTHIVEQIMPFFNPDFTVSAKMVPDLGFYKDIPVILNSITNNIQYEGNYDSVRYVYWTLTFTMKMHYYGPVSTAKIIRNVLVNMYDDVSLKPGYIQKINVNHANGVFKSQDIVFQGNDYKSANAYGIVVNYNSTANTITLGATQGVFKVNNTIHALSTNGVATIQSFDVSPLKLVNIDVKPNPITAQPGDDYGYSINITEWPNT